MIHQKNIARSHIIFQSFNFGSSILPPKGMELKRGKTYLKKFEILKVRREREREREKVRNIEK